MSKANKAAIEALEKQIKKAKKIVDGFDLDSLVNDVMDARDANVNNDGIEGQLKLLVTEYGPEGARKIITDAIDGQAASLLNQYERKARKLRDQLDSQGGRGVELADELDAVESDIEELKKVLDEG